MATTRTFQDMLNEYLPNDLLKEELVKRDYILTHVDKDDSWLGGDLIVPFKAGGASSVSFGSLTAANDIAEDTYVRGKVSGHKELWGSMIFNHRDLMEHGRVSEQNFLKILPDSIEDFMDYLKNVVSVAFLEGAHFATLTGNGDAAGNITVNRPDRFVIGQKVIVTNSDPASVTGYVTSININTGVVHLATARGGLVDLNCAAMTTAKASKCYNDGAATATSFANLPAMMLSQANGGDANILGVAKTLYPFTQAINVSGAAITATNIVEKLFDALTTIRKLGKGNPTEILMSYKNLASVMKVIEIQKGSFNVIPGSQKASQYGWTEIMVGSVTKGAIKFVGVQEMGDSNIIFLDWRALKFYSNGFFQKRKSPEGKEFFEVRATTGYQYIVDVCLFGELVLQRPSYCGIVHSISY